MKWVTRRVLLSVVAFCLSGAAMADEWPGWRGPTRDGVWREQGVVEKFAAGELKIKWRSPISSGYSGPSIADGRVYVTDRVIEPKQVERVHCFDWNTGAPLWMHTYDCDYVNVGYDAGPRASVLIQDGLAYSLGSMAHLFCFDAATGKVVWSHDCHKEYDIDIPIWGIAAAPIIEGDLLIVQIGGKDACLVAFDRKTGVERWRALKDPASYSAPIIIEQAGRRVLACWTGGSVSGLNPTSGEVLWQVPFKPAKMIINVPTPVLENERMFLTSFYDGSYMLEVKRDEVAAKLLWHRNGRDERNTDALQSIIGTPVMVGSHVYGVDSYGEFRCLDGATGERVWFSQEPTPRSRWSTVHIVQHNDQYWLFNERGELIIARLSPKGYEEISRAKLIAPTRVQLRERGGVCWSHPGYAYQHVFARNDDELVCASLIAGEN